MVKLVLLVHSTVFRSAATCQIDIQTVRGAKNVLFGGEGLFNTVVTGPGRVVLQTMALPAFASALIPYLPAKSD